MPSSQEQIDQSTTLNYLVPRLGLIIHGSLHPYQHHSATEIGCN